jgi:integrase
MKMGKLSALRVRSAGPGRHPDGDGLYLIVRDTGSRQWLLRIQADGKRRDLGLGTAETTPRAKDAAAAAEMRPLLDRRSLTLTEARDKADTYRRMIRDGIDPVAKRKEVPAAVPTFEAAARACHEELKAGWRNKKHSESWLACLVTHIFPAMGAIPVDAIDSAAVRDALAPIWLRIPETARRALQRIGAVLDFSHIKGWRPSEVSLRSVPKGLPRQPKTEGHFEAMPYEDAPGFAQGLAAAEHTVGRDALLFTMLNAVRSNETRFATWPEIDFEKATWTIPASRMKMGETHIVPLAPDSVAILRRRWEVRTADEGLVFFSTPRKPISDMTMTKVLRDGDLPTITVHGFRSTFTDWAAETTEIAKEVVDKALAHKLADRVEAAYRRTNFFDRRRALMTLWADYLFNRLPSANAQRENDVGL